MLAPPASGLITSRLGSLRVSLSSRMRCWHAWRQSGRAHTLPNLVTAVDGIQPGPTPPVRGASPRGASAGLPLPSPGKRLPRDAIHRRRTRSTTAPRTRYPKPAHAPPVTTTWRTVGRARRVKSQAKPQPSPLYQSDLRSRRGALAYHLCEVSMPRLPPHAALPRQRRQPPAIMAAPQRRNRRSHQSHCSRGAVSLT